MHPELFEIPYIHLTVKSYGTMIVIGFLLALWVLRKMTRRLQMDPEPLSNAGLYGLISGLAGAKLFFVIHHFDQYRGNLSSIFSGWGFEFLGGVIVATGVVGFYLYRKKQPLLVSLDILAIVLMIGLGFGRIGCLLNGCCYGKITDSSLGIRFPYDSIAYNSQVRPDLARNRTQPQLKIDNDFFGWTTPDGKGWVPAKPEEQDRAALKPYTMLTEQQKELVGGPYQCLKVHPTQLYETTYALTIAGVMLLIWWFSFNKRSGLTMASVMWLYGLMRFINETFRDDNPFEYAWWAIYKGGTISQNISIYLITAGVILTSYFILSLKKR